MIRLPPLQTLYLASMLIKALWNNALAAKAQLSKQSSFASLLNTNIPMGNKKGQSGSIHESEHKRYIQDVSALCPEEPGAINIRTFFPPLTVMEEVLRLY